MQFNYYDKNNQIRQLNIEIGKEWDSYKDKENPKSALNSVFNFVDSNSDGKVDKEELNLLQKLLKVADSQIEQFKNNNIIENEELEYIVDKIKHYEFENLEGNKSPVNLSTPKTIELPNDKNKFTNYSYLQVNFDPDFEDETKIYEVNVDYSKLKNREEGKYYLEFWKTSGNDDNIVKTPVIRKIQNSNQDGTTNWSEGINRNISKIQFANSGDNKLMEFMKQVGEEQGFNVEVLNINAEALWTEDQSIVRADKKQLIPNCNSKFRGEVYEYHKKIIAPRKPVSRETQGNPAQVNRDTGKPTAITYSYTVSPDDIIQGKTYLEGGNVLNTLTKDGEPAAIIGEESLKYTIIAIMLEELSDGNDEYLGKLDSIDFNNVEEYKQKAKKQIAQELGLKEENVTYIPQFDFHIDMYYRPLNNGQMAIPDYKAGIEVLNDLLQNIDKKIQSENFQSEQKEKLESKKQEYTKLLGKLEEMKNKTEAISSSAEKVLEQNGYDIVKIPCFTDVDNGQHPPNQETVDNHINYMNGICGTSVKTGDKYYITNTSGDETLDNYMENYFKNTVGFDKIYFAPTKKYLSALGGIDCLTKEF